MTKTEIAAREKRLASLKLTLQCVTCQRDTCKACVLEQMDFCDTNEECANLMESRYFQNQLRRLRQLENKVYNLTRRINLYN